MTGFGGPRDGPDDLPKRVDVAAEATVGSDAPSAAVVSSEGTKVERSESDHMRELAAVLGDNDRVKRWLNEYADLLDRGVGLVTLDLDARERDAIHTLSDTLANLADVEGRLAEMTADLGEKQAKADRRESLSDQMMLRSGHVHDPRPLVAFLYYLARDEMPMGDIDGILIRLKELELDFGEYGFTNGWIARWAQDTAERLGLRREG